jgi:hypothetical protein
MASGPSKRKHRAVRAEVTEPPGFKALSKAGQIRYLQKLWDRIADGPRALPVPKSHLRLAKQRLAAYRRKPSRTRRVTLSPRYA